MQRKKIRTIGLEIVCFYKSLKHKLTLMILIILALLLIILTFYIPNSNIQSLFTNMGTGIITSIIFYIITIEYTFYKNNRALTNTISNRVTNLSSKVNSILSELSKIAKRKNPNFQINENKISDADIVSLCKIVCFQDKIQVNQYNFDLRKTEIKETSMIIDYIQSKYQEIELDLKDIFLSLNDFMDSELIILLNQFYYDPARIVFHVPYFKLIGNQAISGFTKEIIWLNNWSNQLLNHNNRYYKINQS